MDYNDAGEQKNFDVIPAGTIATVQMKLRRGGAGEGGWLKRSKDGNSEALDPEFLVLDGPFARRKFWTLMTVQGTTAGHAEAGAITASRIRAILESARGVRPDDKSDAAKQARRIDTYGDLDALAFVAKIGVEAARDNYQAKNVLLAAVTPDMRDWHPVEQAAKAPSSAGGSGPAPAAIPAKIERPKWAS
jgi:hypothetical protein